MSFNPQNVADAFRLLAQYHLIDEQAALGQPARAVEKLPTNSAIKKGSIPGSEIRAVLEAANLVREQGRTFAEWLGSHRAHARSFAEVVSGPMPSFGLTVPSGLDPTVAGSKFDPSRILPQVVDETKGRVKVSLSTANLERVLGARLLKDARAIATEIAGSGVLQRAVGTFGRDDVDTLVKINHSQFIRRPAELLYARDRILPSFRDRAEIVTADIGPGFVKFPVPIFGKSDFTYEPWILKSLDPRIKVKPYDFSRHSLDVMRHFDGTLAFYAYWEFADDRGLRDPENVQNMSAMFGDRWINYCKMQEAYFNYFMQVTGGRFVQKVQIDNQPVYVIKIPPSFYQGIDIPQSTTDVVIDPMDGPWDMAFMHIYNWLDLLSGEDTLGVIALMRVVDRLKADSYLFTEPPFSDGYKSTTHRRVPYIHSPSPALAKALGLEAVIDFRQFSATGKMGGMIFKKVGPTNDFVREHSDKIEEVLERLRRQQSGYTGGSGSPIESGAGGALDLTGTTSVPTTQIHGRITTAPRMRTSVYRRGISAGTSSMRNVVRRGVV